MQKLLMKLWNFSNICIYYVIIWQIYNYVYNKYIRFICYFSIMVLTMKENNSISTQQYSFGLPKDSQMNKWWKLNEVNILKLQDAWMASRLVDMIDAMKDNDLSWGEHLQDYAQHAVNYIMSEFGPREKDLNSMLTELATLPVSSEVKNIISTIIKKEIDHNKDKPRFSDRKALAPDTNTAKIEELKAML